MSSAGLRETKKAATRQALAAAVLRLATRDGFDAVSVDAVAAEVGVSTRTFHNYFTSKEEALRSYMGAIIERVFERIESRPADEPFFDALCAGFLAVICDSGEKPTELVHLMCLIDTRPAVVLADDHEAHADEIVGRFVEVAAGRDPGADPMYVELAIACVTVSARVALQMWSRTDRGDLRDVLSTAFGRLRSGFVPSGSHRRTDNPATDHPTIDRVTD